MNKDDKKEEQFNIEKVKELEEKLLLNLSTSDLTDEEIEEAKSMFSKLTSDMLLKKNESKIKRFFKSLQKDLIQSIIFFLIYLALFGIFIKNIVYVNYLSFFIVAFAASLIQVITKHLSYSFDFFRDKIIYIKISLIVIYCLLNIYNKLFYFKNTISIVFLCFFAEFLYWQIVKWRIKRIFNKI